MTIFVLGKADYITKIPRDSKDIIVGTTCSRSNLEHVLIDSIHAVVIFWWFVTLSAMWRHKTLSFLTTNVCFKQDVSKSVVQEIEIIMFMSNQFHYFNRILLSYMYKIITSLSFIEWWRHLELSNSTIRFDKRWHIVDNRKITTGKNKNLFEKYRI